jgi:hypothetical protein
VRIFVLTDSDVDGESILFLSTDRKTLEDKKLDIELLQAKYEMNVDSWEAVYENEKEAAGFDDEDDCTEWDIQHNENFPYPEVPDVFIWGDLVIKEYETI